MCIEYSTECFCGVGLGLAVPYPNECNMVCGGDPSQACGGANRLTIFVNPAYSGPYTNPGVNNFTHSGCYTDSVHARTLSRGQGVLGGSTAMTVASCTTACLENNYQFAGVEYARGKCSLYSSGICLSNLAQKELIVLLLTECFCGNEIANNATLVPGTPDVNGCSHLCQGNVSEFCGGDNRLNIYSLNISDSPTEYIDNGDFETNSNQWITEGIITGMDPGRLQVAVSSSADAAKSYSYLNGFYNLRISDPSYSSTQPNSSICTGKPIYLDKVGTYKFSAAVGRISGNTTQPNDVQFQIIMRHYTGSGVVDYPAGPPQEACSSSNSTHHCTERAANGELVYELVGLDIPILESRVGTYLFYFCGIFNGVSSYLNVLLADNLSLKL